MAPSLRDRITGGLLGLLVGDALGVPVEFLPRERLRGEPVSGMIGHGTHNQPAGTWSDDSSLALCSAASLAENGWDLPDMAERFRRWMLEGYMRPHGELFDIGHATRSAIFRYAQARGDALAEGKDAPDFFPWGGAEERDNGNGSLMRMFPASAWVRGLPAREIAEKSFFASAITHAHVRSKLCCAIFSLVVREVLEGRGLPEALDAAWRDVGAFVPSSEEGVLGDILSGLVLDREEDAIASGGYVVHTLEASLWACHRFGTFREAVLAAVNLGGDSDTTGAVTGALAGAIHGREAIPSEWIDALARRNDVLALAEAFADAALDEKRAV